MRPLPSRHWFSSRSLQRFRPWAGAQEGHVTSVARAIGFGRTLPIGPAAVTIPARLTETLRAQPFEAQGLPPQPGSAVAAAPAALRRQSHAHSAQHRTVSGTRSGCPHVIGRRRSSAVPGPRGQAKGRGRGRERGRGRYCVAARSPPSLCKMSWLRRWASTHVWTLCVA